MHHLCIAIIITSLHWTLLLACFIIIVVAIFICFYVFYSCLVCVCHIIIKGYLLTYLLTYNLLRWFCALWLNQIRSIRLTTGVPLDAPGPERSPVVVALTDGAIARLIWFGQWLTERLVYISDRSVKWEHWECRCHAFRHIFNAFPLEMTTGLYVAYKNSYSVHLSANHVEPARYH